MTDALYPTRFDAAQAAAYLGGLDPVHGQPRLSARSVLDAFRAGRLPGVKVGGRVLFDREDLDAYLGGYDHNRAGC